MSKNEENVQYLFSGGDAGNTNIKVSYLDNSGNIKDLIIPTIIANAPAHISDLGSSKAVNPTDNIHILLKPIDTDGFIKGGYYFVGLAAKLSENPVEAQDSVHKHDSQLHMIALITGEAIAGLENGLEGKVVAPPSYGLPVELVKSGASASFLNRMKGSFEITFIDGFYKGKTITIKHEVDENRPVRDYIHAEATKAGLGLGFDIKKFELEENDVDESIVDPEKPLIINDPGGVTCDIAVFEANGINPTLSTTYIEVPKEFEQANLEKYVGKKVGGNHVVETLQELVNKAIVDVHKENNLPIFNDSFFRDRAEFIDVVLKPYTESLVKGEKEPKIVRSFGYVANLDLTDIVVPVLDEYGEMIYYLNMLTRQKASTIQNNMIAGGGVILGYKVLRERQQLANGSKLYELPPEDKLHISIYINSRGYLVESFLKNPDIVEKLKKKPVKK
ncbi:hypothetical protein POF51_26005 [Brevibacillus sp. AG]|uniref:hypothetical protein n=1 Tax=Brevibacillus sp. AG TaxID=3020891 RepID=UPI00232EC6C6|nr:hypothetical protein [Brevibacillus sp. AG]MDC0764178.1 hypothetical protein [Brevibacillus sp. AG]